MLDDSFVGSKWHGRVERDYIPPGSHRREEDDEDAPRLKIGDIISCESGAVVGNAGQEEVSLSTQTSTFELRDAGIVEAPTGELTFIDKAEKSLAAPPATATECRTRTEEVATPPRQVTIARKQSSRSKKERSYVPAWEAERLTCNSCGSNKLKCVDSRPEAEGRFRRYKCGECGKFTLTREVKLK